MGALGPGKEFPKIELQGESGDSVSPPVGEALYAFFKTDCPTTEFAWPYLERIHRLAQGRLVVLAVSQDKLRQTRAFHKRLGIDLPTLYDPPPWGASSALGLTNVPAFFLVGPDGKIRESVVGFQKEKMEVLAKRAAELAGQPYAALFRKEEKVPAIKPG